MKMKIIKWIVISVAMFLAGSFTIGVIIGISRIDRPKQVINPPKPIVKAEASYVASLMRIRENPKSGSPKITSPNKEDPDIFYEHETGKAGVPIKNLTFYVLPKDPSSWAFEFHDQEVKLEDLAPTGGIIKMDEDKPMEFYEVVSGPLKGTYVLKHSDWFTIKSLSRAVQDGDDEVCDAKIPNVMSKDDFRDQCRTIITDRLLTPDEADFQGVFQGLNHPSRTKACGLRWESWVKSKNAFGVVLKKNFICTLDPIKNLVRADFQ